MPPGGKEPTVGRWTDMVLPRYIEDRSAQLPEGRAILGIEHGSIP